MAKQKTHEEFLNEANQIIHGRYEIFGIYINNRTKFRCVCNKDGYEWYSTPKNILHGYGCPKCGGTLKLTPEEFAQRMYNINNNIELLSSYVDMKHKIDCRCKIDGYEWIALPQNLLNGHGCPQCSVSKSIIALRKTHNDFVNDVHNLSPTIEILNNYIDNKTNIKCCCKICNHTWETVASNLIAGKGCPVCGLKKRISSITKTTKQFIIELGEVNQDIEIIGEYINTNTPILCKCKIDGNKWFATPSNLLRGTGCPLCNCSHGENAIKNILTNMEINFIPQHKFDDCKHLRPLPFDFYIPNYNLCIEYDGQQHFRPVNFGGCSDEQALDVYLKTKENDLIKNRYCKDNGINLLRIKYSDFNNIENIIQKYFS